MTLSKPSKQYAITPGIIYSDTPVISRYRLFCLKLNMLHRMILLCLLLSGSNCTWAQYLDTICGRGVIKSYYVYGESGSTFIWDIPGANTLSGAHTDSIIVEWDTVPGSYVIRVIQESLHSLCRDTVIDSVLLREAPFIEVIPESLMVCEGEQVQFVALSNDLVSWDNGQHGDTLGFEAVKSTLITCYTGNKCGKAADTAVLTVIEWPETSISYMPQRPELHEMLVFNADTTEGWEYNWLLPEGDYSQDMPLYFPARFPGEHQMQLMLSSEKLPHCVDTLLASFRVYDDIVLWVANAFTPDGDGVNDVFEVKTSDPTINYYIAIYDRWGQEVFTSRKISTSWNGRLNGSPCPADVYAYKIIYSRSHEGANGLRHQKTGMVVLLR